MIKLGPDVKRPFVCSMSYEISSPSCVCPPASGQLIERVLLSSMLNPGEQWQTYRHHGRTLSLEYWLRFRCDSNYYGPLCNKLCRARDDFFGHFNCDPSGSKVCMEGWMGPECKEGERETHESNIFIYKKSIKTEIMGLKIADSCSRLVKIKM